MPAEILHGRMHTAVMSEDMQGVAYNPTLLECARHYGFLLRACRAYRPKSKIKGPFRHVREDFFLARSFRNLDHLNAQLRQWLDGVANARVRATTRRVLAEHYAEERASLKPLPPAPFQATLRPKRRITRNGMISVDGNLSSVPDSTRRTVEVHLLADELRIAEENRLVASHPVLEGYGHRRLAGRHRRPPSSDSRAAVTTGAVLPARPGETILRRQLALHASVAQRFAKECARS